MPTQVKPKLELKNVKINKAMSDETLCFSATLYVDGKRASVVTNRGHGGPNDFDAIYDETKFAEFEAFAAEQEDGPEAAGYLVDKMMVEYEKAQWVKKDVMFRLKSKSAGLWQGYAHKKSKSLEARIVAIIEKEHGDDVAEILRPDPAILKKP